MNRLFVYGIFLGKGARARYGMSNPKYATVKGYATFGDYIVAAYPIDSDDVCLTGLIVDVDPSYWNNLDLLEGGYNRVKIVTTDGETAYMYQGK